MHGDREWTNHGSPCYRKHLNESREAILHPKHHVFVANMADRTTKATKDLDSLKREENATLIR